MNQPAGEPGAGARRFASNTAWLVAGDAIAKIAAFVFVILVARSLGTESYGHFNFAISFIPLFLVLAVWGLDDMMFREISRDREEVSRIFASGIIVRIAFAAVALAIATIAASFLVEERTAMLALLLIGVALVLDEIAGSVSTVFKAFEAMKFRAIRILVNRLVTLALAVAAIASGGGLLLVSGMYALGSLVALAYAWWALRRHFPPIRLGDRAGETMRSLVRQGAPLGIAGVLNMAVFRLDTTMLQGMRGPAAVAMYGVAYRFFDSFLFIAWALANVMLPRVTRAGVGPQTTRTFEVVLLGVLSVYLPLAVGAPFAAEWVVGTVFGARYSGAAPAVVILVPALVVYGAGYLARLGCIALGRRRAILQIAAVALVVNVGGNLLAIPRWGVVGAAGVTLATGTIELLALMIVFLRGNPAPRVKVAVAPPALAAALMGLTLLTLNVEGSGAIVWGTVIYLIVLVIGTRAFAPDVWQQASTLTRSRRR